MYKWDPQAKTAELHLSRGDCTVQYPSPPSSVFLVGKNLPKVSPIASWQIYKGIEISGKSIVFQTVVKENGT